MGECNHGKENEKPLLFPSKERKGTSRGWLREGKRSSPLHPIRVKDALPVAEEKEREKVLFFDRKKTREQDTIKRREHEKTREERCLVNPFEER